jgi:hypothetical protein
VTTEAEIGPRLKEVEDRIKAALNHEGVLDQASVDFLRSLQVRLRTYRARTYVSVKQLNWLTRIEQDIASHTAG